MTSPKVHVRARGAGATPKVAALVIRLGAILMAFAIAMLVEYLVVAALYRSLLTGAWETAAMRTHLMPVATGILVPTAVLATFVGALAERTPTDGVARRLLAGLSIVCAAALAWGVSGGRRMAAPTVRSTFVLVVALSAGVLTFVIVPRLARLPRGRLALVGIVVAAIAWICDVTVLPRLYPAFHSALFLVFLGGVALSSVSVPVERAWARWAAVIALAASTAGLLAAKGAASGLLGFDNLRLVLVERAPIFGRAVRLASVLAPPAPDAAGPGEGVLTGAESEGGATGLLDLRGRDVLFLSIDALRADHVGAYGYARGTTPNLDRLAREGVRFDAAYSPTPHTSYAVTSMMTGKYMRPLLSLGLGGDSDTWAGLFRRYGYRTAAFYPPAVFFIDEALFAGFRDRFLDFEYRKVEFADAALRGQQIDAYLAASSPDRPLFLWAHFFEPHEPYVVHPGRAFGDGRAPKPIDAYDSEIAEADAALGAVVGRVRRDRPDVVIVVTADHGEEFGEHGGRYHGTTVYDEQVRVPLVVTGKGIAPKVVREPVQTIDLMPTFLAAMRIPRPARVRGRDLGALIAGPARDAPGFAFSETEDHTMIAEGASRLVCERKLAACALYDVASDPKQTKDLSRGSPDVFARLRQRGAELARSHGRFEAGVSAALPEALRRALQGDREAAMEVAPLLDDVRADLRAAAARAMFELAVPETLPFAVRAFSMERDPSVKPWAAVALVRVGGPSAPPSPAARAFVEDLLARGDPDWRFRAALALAEAGDGRGVDVLAERLDASGAPAAPRDKAPSALSFAEERAVVRVLGALKDKRGVRALVRVLGDVRLRPEAAAALASIGDPAARAPLLERFAEERYVSMRAIEAKALLALGARAEIEAPLSRFAGVPEPWPEALAIAEDAGLVGRDVRRSQTVAPHPSQARRLYLRSGPRSPDGDAGASDVTVIEIEPGATAGVPAGTSAVWLVPRAEELSPPAPVPWDGGLEAGGFDPAARAP